MFQAHGLNKFVQGNMNGFRFWIDNYYWIREGTPNRIAHPVRVLSQRLDTPPLFNCYSEIAAEGRVTMILLLHAEVFLFSHRQILTAR